MSWWYVSSVKLTCAVRVERGVIVEGAPIVRRFIGQPATNLGRWLRAQGDVQYKRLPDLTHIYCWGNNEKRAALKGRPCRIVAHAQTMRSVLVEFADGQREVVSFRALRKAKP
jgi:hypothetical protein